MDDPEQNMWSTQLIFLVVMYPQRMDGKEFIQRGVFLMNTVVVGVIQAVSHCMKLKNRREEGNAASGITTVGF